MTKEKGYSWQGTDRKRYSGRRRRQKARQSF